MKKAQGLPITTIIIAVLGLVVLIVIMGIFGVRSQKFGKGVSEVAEPVCQAQYVASMTDCDARGGEAQVGSFVKEDKSRLGFTEVCCSKAQSP